MDPEQIGDKSWRSLVLWKLETHQNWEVLKNLKKIGLVAQLNSAPDYGSGGSRFESWQGHKYYSLTS